MSTVALNGLLEYLYSTLTTNNMRWVGEHLIEYAKKEDSERLRPFTMKEINDMLDEAEQQFASGQCKTSEQVWEKYKHELSASV